MKRDVASNVNDEKKNDPHLNETHAHHHPSTRILRIPVHATSSSLTEQMKARGKKGKNEDDMHMVDETTAKKNEENVGAI